MPRALVFSSSTFNFNKLRDFIHLHHERNARYIYLKTVCGYLYMKKAILLVYQPD